MNTNQALHVVLGAGQIGPRVRDLLLAAGHRVRMVRQGPAGPAQANLEWRSGDIRDPAFAEAAAAGASVIYDCMNPPYHRWPELLFPIAGGALRGAATSGARLVALDCLYMYGRPQGPLSEDSPLRPCSKKGELRLQLANLRLAAHARGDVRVAIGRASDFLGTDLQYSAFSDRFFQRILAGKPAECMGDPDMPHAYSYADDVARGLVTLGASEAALGHVWHLPTNPAESTRALVARIGRGLGVEATTQRLPRWLLRSLGVLSPVLREMVEMTYQWEVPFEVDDTRFVRTFGWAATPLEDAVTEITRWAKARYLRQVA